MNFSLKAQYCGTGSSLTCGGTEDYSNFGLNSNNNPNTIAYDNWVAGYHASTIRNTDGTFSIWGENMDATGTGHITAPQQINSTNYPGLTGTVLKASVGGYNQAVILTTTGLFVVGRGASPRTGGYIFSTTVINTPAFTKLNATSNANIINGTVGTGLPSGVNPASIKMMFVSSGVIAITTCSGEVYVISQIRSLRGNGTSSGTNVTTDGTEKNWFKVQKSAGVDLTNIVATRGNGGSLFALDSNGKLYTWGYFAYKGNGDAPATTLTYATEMTLPNLNGAQIKMIGTTNAVQTLAGTYYVLATDGKLYSMGRNHQHQLGNWSDVESRIWVRPTYDELGALPMDDIKWISPQEHYTAGYDNGEGSSSINAISSAGILTNWGYNRRGMLGRPDKNPGTPSTSPNNIYDPGVPINDGTVNNAYPITATTQWNAVETGGHTTMAVRPCEVKLIYAGHRINGSMGNGEEFERDQYSFTNYNTPELKICGASAVNHQIAGGVTTFCQGSTFTVNSSPAGGTYNVTSGNATGNNPFTVTGPGDIVITYTSSCGSPDTFILYQKDFGNLTFPYPQASATINASNSVWLGPNVTGIPNSDCSIQPTDAADGFSITNAVCGSGTSATPWTVRANQTLTFNVTINGSGAQKPVYWALWYDVNGDGDFTDTDDMFYTGNSTHNGPTPTSFQTIIPTSVTTLPANTIAAIRIVATASLTTFTKQLNGDVQVANGEVEDYFINYNTATVCENCFNLPTGGLPDSYTKTGISSLEGFANGWPNNVPNGFIAIESKNKGFVITRIKNVSLIPTANLVAGMLVYEIDASCVKLFNGTSWKCLEKDCIPIAINP